MVVVYPEIIQLVVSTKSGVNSFEDLKGKRISFGSVGGSVTATSESIFRAAGFEPDKDIKVEYLGHADATASFADRRIDAAINMGALGISSVTEPTTTGTVKLLSLSENVIKTMCEKRPYFSPATIPAGT